MGLGNQRFIYLLFYRNQYEYDDYELAFEVRILLLGLVFVTLNLCELIT